MKKTIQTILAITTSILLTGLGVALFVHANLGSDTLTVFVDGLHRVLNCSYGTASRIYNLIVLVIALIVSRKNIGWATIVYALSVGFTMDYFEKIVAAVADSKCRYDDSLNLCLFRTNLFWNYLCFIN